MPAFIFISGLFSKKTLSSSRLTKERIFYFLVLYLLCKIFLKTVSFFFYKKINFSLLNESGVPWFMLGVAAWYGITFLLKDFNKYFVLALSILLACVTGYDDTIRSFLSLSRIIVFFPFFFLGYLLDPEKLVNILKKPVLCFIGRVEMLFLILLSIIYIDKLYLFRPLLTGVNPFSALPHPIYGAFYRLVYYSVALLAVAGIIAVIPQKQIPISKFGQRTLQVYFLHYTSIYIFKYFQVNHILQRYFPGKLWIIFYLFASIIFTLIFSAKFWEYPFKYLNALCKLRN